MHLLPFRTLRGRLTLLACLATLPAFLFVVYVATEERGAALRRAETESLYVADMASRQHAYHLLGARQLLDRIPALVATDEYGLGDLPKLLSAILSGLPQFANLGVINLDGKIAYSVIPPSHQVNMAGIEAVQRALESREVAVGTYLVGPIVARPILIMAKALRNAQGRPMRVLFAALDLAWLDRLAQEAGLPAESAMLIVDRNGTILASSLSTRSERGADNRLKGFAQLIQHPNSLTPCEAPDGIARLAVATPLKGVNDVWVVVGSPEANIHAAVNWIFIRDLTVLALFAVFAIISSLIATDLSVLRDIRLLANATQRFGRGELNVRAPIPLPGGEIRDLTEAFNTMADMLERRHRQALRSQERLRALSHRLRTARESEAARIAQELHDELGQELSVLHVELEYLRRKVANGNLEAREEILSLIDNLGERLGAAVGSVRRIASELRPGVLDRLGLSAGLEWLLNEFGRRTGVHTALAVEGIDEAVDADVSTALFRITQEALTNVARHSGASAVKARLTGNADDIQLCIEDNGSGFDPTAELQGPSLGLLGMKERASRLGGTLDIRSAAAHGTEFCVKVPRRAAQGPEVELEGALDEDPADR